MVCCRGGKSRAPPDRIFKRLSSRESKAGGGRIFMRAAASSIAKGSPSNREHICAMTPALLFVRVKSRFTADARLTNNSIAGKAANAFSDNSCPAAGTDKGDTANSCSPPG